MKIKIVQQHQQLILSKDRLYNVYIALTGKLVGEVVNNDYEIREVLATTKDLEKRIKKVFRENTDKTINEKIYFEI